MKMFFAKLIILFGFLAFASPALAQDESEAPDLGAIVAEYIEAWAAINQLDTTHEDREHYNTFFTSDMTYELPVHGLVFEAEGFLEIDDTISGLVRNSEYSVEEIIVGKGVVFIKVNLVAEGRRSTEGEWQSFSRSEFLVFEFEDDKIKRVIGY